MQSPSSSRIRRRAGASSSTIRTREGRVLAGCAAGCGDGWGVMWLMGLAAVLAIGQVDVNLVGVAHGFGIEARFRVEMQGEPLADVLDRHPVARMRLPGRIDRVGQNGVQPPASGKDVDRNLARLVR